MPARPTLFANEFLSMHRGCRGHQLMRVLPTVFNKELLNVLADAGDVV